MMPILPQLTMKVERQELVKKTAKPFTCFVSRMSAPTVLHCLALMDE
jgi:hypothetical protein